MLGQGLTWGQRVKPLIFRRLQRVFQVTWGFHLEKKGRLNIYACQ